MTPAAVRRALWTLPVTYAAGVALHLWIPLRLLPWWILAVPLGATILVASKPLLFPSPRRSPDGRTLAGAAVAYAGAALLVNSLWPLVLLVPAVSFAVRWGSPRRAGDEAP